jgi:hypothetical protein
MARGDTGRARRVFFGAFLRGLRVLWPVLSGLFAVIACLGAVVGAVEKWGVAQGVYFAFITGLTIGYGDLAPSRAVTKILAIVVGFLGIVATGLVAALAVTAFQATPIVRGRSASRVEPPTRPADPPSHAPPNPGRRLEDRAEPPPS